MNKLNLYWPVYMNLEKEFLRLANYIHIADDQVNVYSMYIADLIVRCSVEIESLSKELYEQNGGNVEPVDENGEERSLYFDTDCLKKLEEIWQLSKKEIFVSASNLYFCNSENLILTPLHKAYQRGKGTWKKAYQAIKHSRVKSLQKATLRNLLLAMGALYILNLYYKDETISIGRVNVEKNDFDSRVGSNLFSVHYCKATILKMSQHIDDSCIASTVFNENELSRSVYIIRYDDDSIREMHKNFCLDEAISVQNYFSSSVIYKFLLEHPEYREKSMNEVCIAAGGETLLKEIICHQHEIQGKNAKREAILNKHSTIYPELLPR